MHDQRALGLRGRPGCSGGHAAAERSLRRPAVPLGRPGVPERRDLRARVSLRERHVDLFFRGRVRATELPDEHAPRRRVRASRPAMREPRLPVLGL
jgi:hypothetical protein